MTLNENQQLLEEQQPLIQLDEYLTLTLAKNKRKSTSIQSQFRLPPPWDQQILFSINLCVFVHFDSQLQDLSMIYDFFSTADRRQGGKITRRDLKSILIELVKQGRVNQSFVTEAYEAAPRVLSFSEFVQAVTASSFKLPLLDTIKQVGCCLSLTGDRLKKQNKKNIQTKWANVFDSYK